MWRYVQRQTYGCLPNRRAQPWPAVLISYPAEAGGWVGLTGWLHTRSLHLRTVTHISANRARRRSTSLTWPGPNLQPTTLNRLTNQSVMLAHIGRQSFLVSLTTRLVLSLVSSHPLPSNRHQRSNGDCLGGKRQNYQVCSLQYCAQQLCTVQCTHIWTDLTGEWVLSHWAHFTLLRFNFVPVYVLLHACVVL